MAVGPNGLPVCSECGTEMRATGTGEFFCDNAKCDMQDVHYTEEKGKFREVLKKTKGDK